MNVGNSLIYLPSMTRQFTREFYTYLTKFLPRARMQPVYKIYRMLPNPLFYITLLLSITCLCNNLCKQIFYKKYIYFVYFCACMYVCMHSCICVHTVCVCACMYVCICVHVGICVYAFVTSTRSETMKI